MKNLSKKLVFFGSGICVALLAVNLPNSLVSDKQKIESAKQAIEAKTQWRRQRLLDISTEFADCTKKQGPAVCFEKTLTQANKVDTEFQKTKEENEDAIAFYKPYNSIIVTIGSAVMFLALCWLFISERKTKKIETEPVKL